MHKKHSIFGESNETGFKSIRLQGRVIAILMFKLAKVAIIFNSLLKIYYNFNGYFCISYP